MLTQEIHGYLKILNRLNNGKSMIYTSCNNLRFPIMSISPITLLPGKNISNNALLVRIFQLTGMKGNQSHSAKIQWTEGTDPKCLILGSVTSRDDWLHANALVRTHVWLGNLHLACLTSLVGTKTKLKLLPPRTFQFN